MRPRHSPEQQAEGYTKAKLWMLCGELHRFRLDHGSFPPKEAGFDSIVDPKDERRRGLLIDDWNRPFLVLSDRGRVVGALSRGTNGTDERGDGDDFFCTGMDKDFTN